jgi:hypothetical protein
MVVGLVKSSSYLQLKMIGPAYSLVEAGARASYAPLFRVPQLRISDQNKEEDKE